MKITKKIQEVVTVVSPQYGVILEVSASSLTKGGDRGYFEAMGGKWPFR